MARRCHSSLKGMAKISCSMTSAETARILEETGEGGNLVEVVVVLGEDMMTSNDLHKSIHAREVDLIYEVVDERSESLVEIWFRDG
ncbi:hypothetical protein I308_101194 [Cryptococcus tetragattii IND107]|uniref:Uncharacterized protein n=1 Tax=Cryptococcus tetragattii IND107 TaxID=1296105 RepID=A0ABR3BZK4_9TREE